MTIYYVYAYLRKKDNSPYYIGKGKGNRAWAKHSNVSTPKDQSKIVICEQNLTELGALAIERRLIKWYGRKVNGSGILHNKTEGGDTTYGISNPQTPESNLKRSIKLTGIKRAPFSEEHRKKISLSGQNKKQSIETKNKRAEKLKGLTHPPRTDEWKQKQAISKKGKPWTEARRMAQRKGK